MMQNLVAFCQGFIEFRSDVTTHYDDYDVALWYDHGRDLAHKLTLRRYEQF